MISGSPFSYNISDINTKLEVSLAIVVHQVQTFDLSCRWILMFQNQILFPCISHCRHYCCGGDDHSTAVEERNSTVEETITAVEERVTLLRLRRGSFNRHDHSTFQINPR